MLFLKENGKSRLAKFGAERCNFESNFPVDKMGTATRRCGTRSSASPCDAHRSRSSPSIAARRSGSTISTEVGSCREQGLHPTRTCPSTSSGNHPAALKNALQRGLSAGGRLIPNSLGPPSAATPLSDGARPRKSGSHQTLRWRRQSRANSSLFANSLLAGKIQGISLDWACPLRFTALKQ
jgi:hypothetical protein